jgi:hypothetical protein
MSAADSASELDDRASSDVLPSLSPEEEAHQMDRILAHIDALPDEDLAPSPRVSEVRLRSTPPAARPPAAHVGPTMQLPVWDGDARPQAVPEPFPRMPAPRPSSNLAGTDMSGGPGSTEDPFVVRGPDGHALEIPRLTPRQYASLHAELKRAPAWTSVILSRYQVKSEAVHRALDAHWAGVIMQQPELRAQFVADVAEYTAWLAAHWR